MTPIGKNSSPARIIAEYFRQSAGPVHRHGAMCRIEMRFALAADFDFVVMVARCRFRVRLARDAAEPCRWLAVLAGFKTMIYIKTSRPA
jgi:hypothetical protein